jgi:hypothetical protein
MTIEVHVHMHVRMHGDAGVGMHDGAFFGRRVGLLLDLALQDA